MVDGGTANVVIERVQPYVFKGGKSSQPQRRTHWEQDKSFDLTHLDSYL
jgi:hypothetical protein